MPSAIHHADQAREGAALMLGMPFHLELAWPEQVLDDQGKELEQMQQLVQQQEQQLQAAHAASSKKEAAAASAAQLRWICCDFEMDRIEGHLQCIFEHASCPLRK